MILRASNILGLLVLLALAGVAAGRQRVALVIGNNLYDPRVPAGVEPNLQNPVNDARAVQRLLEQLGFFVVLATDATVDQTYEALETFKREARDAELGLFFYSGHGLEVDGHNYLVPVRATLESAAKLRSQTVSLETLLADMAASRIRAKMVVLDCCRDDPFRSRSWRRTRSSALGASGGLAEVKADALPEATLIMFSAAPGQRAADGTGRNSPFTEVFVREFARPGVNCFDAALNVADAVKTSTGGQEPWLTLDGGARALRQFTLLPGNSEITRLVEPAKPSSLPEPRAGAMEMGNAPNNLPQCGYYDLSVLFAGGPFATATASSQGHVLKSVQHLLKRAGYYLGPVDGVVGKAGQQAILAWQRDNEVQPTGKLGRETLAKMGISEVKPSDKEAQGRRPPASKQSASSPGKDSVLEEFIRKAKEFEGR